MGQEIANSNFSRDDFRRFAEHLEAETRTLERWLAEGRFPAADHVGGFELEAWLVDGEASPMAANDQLLGELDDPFVVPELAQFNLELNGSPRILRGDALSRFSSELEETWNRCNRVARRNGARLAMIGILPTVTREHLTPANMSAMNRYQALDEQLERLRGGRPLEIDIAGHDRLRFSHRDVMLESATTSFQIHLRVDGQNAARVYNAAKILSAPMVALSANSPFLFGADLWNETRIPLFEQAVRVGRGEYTNRVSFGLGYVGSIMDCFRGNLERYEVLLPRVSEEPEERLSHLRLHNGTIWRWNRPLVGFDADGAPHLRIEHRVVPAGPTVADAIANAALFFGAACALARWEIPPEQELPFEDARDNFYRAARFGLDARMRWLGGRTATVREICHDSLLLLAEEGLHALGIDDREIGHWLGIIRGRLTSGQTGAVWQRAWVARHGKQFRELTESYLEWQESGRPVHLWPI